MQFVTKTKKDNIVTNHTSAVYAEKETDLSWQIEPSVDYDENHIGQRYD